MESDYTKNYLQYIEDSVYSNDPISLQVQILLARNKYEEPKDWFYAHALCQMCYQTGIIDENVLALFNQIGTPDLLIRCSQDLSDANYAEWFGVTKRLNDIFIKQGIHSAYTFQYNLLKTAREGFSSPEEIQSYLEQGANLGVRACIKERDAKRNNS